MFARLIYSLRPLNILGVLAVLAVACGPAATATPLPTQAPTPSPVPAPTETPVSPEMSEAAELWEMLQGAGYRENWTTVPGKGTFYEGQPPHGALLSTYLNPEAAEGMNMKTGAMPDDATIVKENYTPDETLDSVTVMYKEAGFDPAHGDWFWAKYGPDGEVQAAGKAPGCTTCHGSVQSNDFIFTFPIAPIQFAGGAPTDEDQAMAAELWEMLQAANYQESWDTVPGKGAFYSGQAPHGALLTTYLSPEAVEGMNAKTGQMPEDAIIVKENYLPDETLDSLTVMYKEPGYDPEHNDWFWSKFDADGQVQVAGKGPGCIACHGSVRSNDFIFTFPIAPRP